MLLKIFKNRTVSSSGTWGTKNENNYEILNFEFPEELEEYNKRIVYYLGNQKVWDAIIDNKAILTNAITTKGSVKAYIWCTKSDEAFETDVDFRTQIFVMNFFENDNADGIVPTPEQVDGFNTMLTAMNEKIEEINELETTIENAETQRQENEETRQENESTRQDNEQTRQEQEAERERRTDEAIGNIEDKTAEYNQNAEEKTEAFNTNASQKTNDFNSNYTQKVNDFNTNASSKTSDFNSNAETKTNAFNTNATNKTNDFNSNATEKTTAFNENATSKTNTFNSNANDKTSAFNDNATQKTTNFDNNASEKTDEFNTNAQNKIDEYDEHIVEYQAQIDELQEEVEELSENMPWNTTEQSTEISVDDAAKYSRNKLELFGNTEQQSYQGYNLVQNNLTSQTINGIEFVVNDDKSIKVNGTATQNAIINLINNSISEADEITLPAGTYTLQGCPQGGSNSTYKLDITNDGGSGIITDFGSSTYSMEFSNDLVFDRMRIVIYSGTTVNNLVFKPMLIAGNVQKDYEPYVGGVPSPNPDYPQDIHVVTGENTIEVQGKNLIPGEVFEFCTIANTGEKIQDSTRICTDFIELDPAKQYFLSASINYGFSGIAFYDNTYTYISRLYWNDSKRHTIATTDIPNNTKYVKVFGQMSNAVIASTSEFEKNEWYLEEGAPNNTKYVPYHHADYPINLGSIELCKIGDYQDYLYKENGNWYKYGNIDKIILNGSENIVPDTTKTITQVFNIQNVLKSHGSLQSVGYCNYFINQPGDTEKFSYANATTVAKDLYIAINKTRASTVSEFKDWLSNYNVTLYYPILPTTTTQITDETLISQLEAIYNHLALVKGTNHITITPSDLAPYVTLNYMQDLPSKLDNLDSRLSLLE